MHLGGSLLGASGCGASVGADAPQAMAVLAVVFDDLSFGWAANTHSGGR
jgi:hypothetical protein